MENQKHVPSIDELIELPALSDPQISPDGEQVVYVVRHPDWKENEYTSQIWQVGKGVGEVKSEPRQLTFGKESSFYPRWSPDGKWLAFLSQREEDEHTQVYRMSAYGGEAERLTELESDVSALEWSPGSNAILLLVPDGQDEEDKEREEKYGEFHVDDQDFTHSHLWLLRLPERQTLKLTSGKEFHVTEFEWHPDGKKVAFSAWHNPDLINLDAGWISTVDIDSLSVTRLTGAGYTSPHWSPDGSQLVVSRFGEPSFFKNNQVCIWSAADGEIRQLPTDLDEEIDLTAWRKGGIYFFALQGVSLHLFRLDPASGKTSCLTPREVPGWFCGQCSFDSQDTQAAMIAGDAGHYDDIVVLSLNSSDFQVLTAFNEHIKDWQLGSNENFTWLSTDGALIEGVLVKPFDFDPVQKYPLLVVIHGGPTWIYPQALLSSLERRYYPVQQWIAKGALVLGVNYRGSAGYGEAFRSLNYRNLGVGDAWDVISGVDALIARGWVDPERVGAMGWSQGGYISAFLATYSDRFKAISVGAGISNWMTYYVNTDIHMFTRQYLAATPWADMEIYQKTSPMTYINQAKTPTLIQHGEFDRRVPPPNAYELYQGLKDVGVEARLVIYKGMPHGLTKPRLNRQAMQENLKWFNRWLWGEAEEEPRKTSAYLALCSQKKSQQEGDLPAIQRYLSNRIQQIYHWSRRDGVEFRIFSGKLGLLEATDPIPFYDQRLEAGEVHALAARISEQIKAQGLKKLILYIRDLKEDFHQQVYLGCLYIAASMAEGVIVEQRLFPKDEN
jgi:dipeptidyl aminopeptidase/acylaminoacyl peptidase